MMETITCPWCGQIIMLDEDEDASEWSETELAKEAARKCTCYGAVKEGYIIGTDRAIDKILGSEAETNGMDYALGKGTIDVIRAIVRGIADDYIDCVTLTEPGGDRISISDGGSRATIKRVHKKQLSM